MPYSIVRLSVAMGLLVALGCSSEPETPDPSLVTVREAAKECRTRLDQGDYGAARTVSRGVIHNVALATSVAPKEVHPVRFCYVLSHSLFEFDKSATAWKTLFEAIYDLVEGDLDDIEQAAAGADLQAMATVHRQNQLINSLVEALIKPWRELLTDNADHLSIILAADDFSWQTDRLPIRLAGDELMDMGGTYGLTEVHILYGMTRAMLSTLAMLQSQDYSFNLGAMLAYANVDDTPLNKFDAHPFAAISNFAATLLGTSPQFLTLRADGPARVAAAGDGYLAGLDAVLVGLEKLTERPVGTDHILGYLHEDGQDHIILNATFSKEQGDGSEPSRFADIKIPLGPEVLASMNRVRSNLAGEGRERAHLQQDIFPMAAVLFVTILRSGAFDAIIDDILGRLESDLARNLELTREFAETGQDFLLMLMLAAAPVAMELDLGVVFQDPVDGREILPAWFQPPPNEDETFNMEAFTTATFVYSYECDEDPLHADEPTRFLCPADAPLTDREHFEDLHGNEAPWIATGDNFGDYWEGQIEADGVTSRFPYIGFKDPTMGGVLYIYEGQGDSAGTAAPATQGSLNEAIARSVNKILAIYGL